MLGVVDNCGTNLITGVTSYGITMTGVYSSYKYTSGSLMLCVCVFVAISIYSI